MHSRSSFVRLLSLFAVVLGSCQPSDQALSWSDAGMDAGAAAVASKQQALETSLCGSVTTLQANSPWPMRSGCGTHAARSSEVGTLTNTLNIERDTLGDVRGSAAIAADGSIYITGDDSLGLNGKLHKIAPSGTLTSLTLGGKAQTTPAIGSDGTVYVTSEAKKLAAIDPATLTQRWAFPAGGIISSSPAIGLSGVVYFGASDKKVYAVKSSGVKHWTNPYTTGGAVVSSPALSPDGATLFIGSDDKNLYALNASTGALRWKRLLPVAVKSSPAVGRFNRVYVSAGSKLYAIDATTGVIAWEKALGTGTVYSPAVAESGVIYLGTASGATGSLYAVTPDGAVLWQYDTLGGIESTPIVDKAGNIYFGCNDASVVGLSSAGKQLMKFQTLGPVRSSPAIARGGALIVGSDDNKIRSIGVGVPLVAAGGTCTSDLACEPGLLCGAGNGARFGKPAGSNACWAPSCENKVKDPGETEVDCGGVCGTCTAVCSQACTLGSQVTPPALETLSFAKGAFIRGSVASYQTGANKLALARGDQLRYEDRGDGNGRVALFEGPRTNRIVWSEQLGHLPEWWSGVVSAPTMTLTEDAAVAPDSTSTADRWVAAAAANGARAQTIVNAMPAGSLSAWLRVTDPAYYSVTNPVKTRAVMTDLTGGFYNEVLDWTLPVAWERRSLVTTASTGSTAVQLSHKSAFPGTLAQFPALPAADFAVWGYQLEEGKFPSSYIPTQESAVTRRADLLLFETKDVPAWLRTGVWQLHALPLYSSTEIAAGEEFVLLAWEGGQISFGKDATGGFVQIAAGVNVTKRTIAWNRNSKLTFTLNGTAKTLEVGGATSGNGSGAYASAIALAGTARVSIGALINGTKPAFARISEPRRVASATVACVADPDCVVCGDGLVTGPEACDTALDSRCSAACNARTGLHECGTVGTTCASGMACPAEPNGEAFDLEPWRSFCVPLDICLIRSPAACGTTSAPCGRCPCTPNCGSKQCGDGPGDGCGGLCEGYCDSREGGCTSDSQCGISNDTVLECARGAGAQVGLASGLNVCLPAECLTEAGRRPPLCGTSSSRCGLCPVCTPECNGKQCGGDGCGGICGTCGSGTQCAGDSICAPIPAFPKIQGSPPLPQLPSSSAGATAGLLQISDEGAADYSVPIRVPPGRGGLQPTLALRYNSLAFKTHTYLGMGWSLGGLSSISLCPRNKIQDNYVAPVRFSLADAYCLDGVRLVPIRTTSTEMEFRTELDSMVRVIGRIVATTASIDKFDVFLPDGTRRIYGGVGASATAYDDGRGGARTFTWAISSEFSPLQHTIHYQYDRFQQRQPVLAVASGCNANPNNNIGCSQQPLYQALAYTAELRPKSIAYGGVSCGSLTDCLAKPRNHLTVEFKYDKPLASAGGDQTTALTAIETRADNALVTRYEIGYALHSPGHLRPVNLRECDGTTCLSPTSFVYDGWALNNPDGKLSDDEFVLSEDGPGLYEKWQGDNYAPDWMIANRAHALDIDGDGFSEILFNRNAHTYGGTPNWRLLKRSQGMSMNDTDVSMPFPKPWWIIAATDSSATVHESMVVGDYNGDSRDDILVEYIQSGNTARSFLGLYRSNGTSLTKTVDFAYDGGGADRKDSWTSFDADGDGWDDVVMCIESARVVRVHWNDAGAFSTSKDFPLESAVGCKTWLTIDADADGVVEYLSARELNEHLYFYSLDISDRTHAEWLNTFVGAGANGYRAGDFDGDGRVDLVSRQRIGGVPIAWGGVLQFWHNRAWGFEKLTRPTPWLVPSTTQPSLINTSWAETAFVHASFPDLNEDGVSSVMSPLFPGSDDVFKDRIKGAWHELMPLPVVREDGVFRGFASTSIDRRMESSIGHNVRIGNPTSWYNLSGVHEGLAWADLNGDGLRDPVFVTRGSKEDPDIKALVTEAKSQVRARLAVPRRALLSSITDGLGHRDEIVYASPTDRSVYEPLGSCPDPLSVCRATLPVGTVASHVEASAAGTSSASTPVITRRYWYFDGRQERAGRGSLGYAKRAVLETATGYEQFTVLSYDLRHRNFDTSHMLITAPFAKIPTKIEVLTELREGRASVPQNPVWRLQVESRAWSTKLSAAGVPFAYLDSSTVRNYEQALALPEERKANLSFVDLFGVPVTSTVVDPDVDQYNNQTEVIVEDFNGDRTEPSTRTMTQRTTFSPTAADIAKWQVRYPKNQTTTSFSTASWPTTRYETYVYVDGFLSSITRANSAGATPFVSVAITPNSWMGVRRVEVQDPNQPDTRAVVYGYDSRGMYPVNVEHHVGGGAAPLVTLYDYSDAFGHVRVRKDAAGIKERYGFDGFGRLAWRDEASGRQTNYSYADNGPSCNGCELWVTERSGAATFPSAPTGDGERVLAYDAFGNERLRRFRGFGGVWVQSTADYDGFGRLTRETRPRVDGDTTQGTRSVEYDNLGRVVRVSDGLGSSEYSYASANTLASDLAALRTVPAVPGQVWWQTSAARWFALVYDEGSNAVSVEVSDATGAVIAKREGGAVRRYAYDGWGALKQIVVDGQPSQNRSRLTDAWGRLARVVDPDAGTYDFTYFGTGELQREVTPSGTVAYTYDALGRIDTRTDPEGTSTWTWDRFDSEVAPGRLVRMQSVNHERRMLYAPGTGMLRGTVDLTNGQTFTTTLDRDGQGRPELLRYPERHGLKFGVKHNYDAWGNLLSVFDADVGQTKKYWEMIQADQGYRSGVEKVGTGQQIVRGYEPNRGYLASVGSRTNASTPTSGWGYYYNARGERVASVKAFSGQSAVWRSYRYTPEGRLSGVLNGIDASASVLESYAYGALGAFTTTSRTPSYSYSHGGGAGGPNAVGGTSSGWSFGYDSKGNQTNRAGPGVSQTIQFSSFNLPLLLEQVKNGVAATYTFDYDALGNRVAKHSPQSDTYYAGGVYQERSTGGVIEAQYSLMVHGRKIGVVSKVVGTPGATERYLLDDPTGSPLAVVSSGSVEFPEREAFGLTSPGASELGSRFAGHDADVDLGLVNMEGRMYDPNLGTFLTPDPFVQDPLRADSLNRYVYAWNDPLGYGDPTGFQTEVPPVDNLPDLPVPPGSWWSPGMGGTWLAAGVAGDVRQTPIASWGDLGSVVFDLAGGTTNALTGNLFESDNLEPANPRAYAVGQLAGSAIGLYFDAKAGICGLAILLEGGGGGLALAPVTGTGSVPAVSFPSVAAGGTLVVGASVMTGIHGKTGMDALKSLLTFSKEVRPPSSSSTPVEGAFSVGPYRPTVSTLENHHGVLDIWASHNIPGYVSRGASTPTIRLTSAQHAATKAAYRDWLFEKTGRRVGGAVEWTQVSAREVLALTNRMFDAAGVPAAARAEYFRAFHQYIYGVAP